MSDSRSFFAACTLKALVVCIVVGGGCNPCAAVRSDLDRVLRQNAALVGVGVRADSGWLPHAELVVGHDVLQRLVPVLDSGAALPELRVDGVQGNVSWLFRATPRLVSLAVVTDDLGQPALRLRFFAGDGTSVRLRGSGSALAAVAEAIAVVPIVADIERPVQVDADFGQATVVEASAVAEYGLDVAVTEAVTTQWAAELERILRIDVGAVELFHIQAAIGLEPRIVGLALGENDSLALLLVTAMRPQGVAALDVSSTAPSSSLLVHPGLLEAWIRERTADNVGRRTVDDAGKLDASGQNVVTLRAIESGETTLVLNGELWCFAPPECSVDTLAAAAERSFGRSGVAYAFGANAQVAGWLSMIATEAAALLNGFSIVMPDSPVVRLLPRASDDDGRLLLRMQLPEGAH